MKSSVQLERSSVLTISSTLDEVHVDAADRLAKLLSSCFGPHGKKRLIGRPDNIRAFTSITSRILSAINVRHPLNAIVVAGLKKQIEIHGDGAATLGLSALTLFRKWREADLHPAAADGFLERLFGVLHRDASTLLPLTRLDPFRCQDALRIVKTVLTSNSVFHVAPGTRSDHFAALILRAFIDSIGEGDVDPNARIHFHRVFGLDLEDTILVPGLVFPKPVDFIEPLPLEDGFLVAVFDVSLGGDFEEHNGNRLEGNVVLSDSYAPLESFLDVNIFVEKAAGFFDTLIDDFKVSLIFCQKVMHPRLKSHLIQRGISFVDRISAQSTIDILRLTGALPISSLHDTVSVDRLGKLDAVESRRLPDDKTYLHLHSASSASGDQTVVLCAPTEETFLEAKSLIQTCFSVLRSSTTRPVFVDGGGCYLASLRALILNDDDASVSANLTSESPESIRVFRKSLNVVADTLKSMTMEMTSTEPLLSSLLIDGHHWMIVVNDVREAEIVNCACGRKRGTWDAVEASVTEIVDTDQGPQRLDSFVITFGAIQTGFELGVLLLNTDVIVTTP